jgi:phospholipid/cholesterol/gamma-HCH transport system permease protein
MQIAIRYSFVEKVIRHCERELWRLGIYIQLVMATVRDICTRGVNAKDFFKYVVEIGNKSLPISLLTAIFTGMVLALQTAYGLQRFGVKQYVGNIVSLSLVRELGPVLTGIMICGRVGAGITAEIASMVVTEQVDAIRALGANPIRKLVSPRLLAGMVVMPMLALFADIIGIIGGGMIAVWELRLPYHTYYRSVITFVTISDVLDGLIKATAFGFIIITIACFYALQCRGGTEGVGRATTAAVVTGSIAILVSDFFLTKLLILLG